MGGALEPVEDRGQVVELVCLRKALYTHGDKQSLVRDRHRSSSRRRSKTHKLLHSHSKCRHRRGSSHHRRSSSHHRRAPACENVDRVNVDRVNEDRVNEDRVNVVRVNVYLARASGSHQTVVLCVNAVRGRVHRRISDAARVCDNRRCGFGNGCVLRGSVGLRTLEQDCASEERCCANAVARHSCRNKRIERLARCDEVPGLLIRDASLSQTFPYPCQTFPYHPCRTFPSRTCQTFFYHLC